MTEKSQLPNQPNYPALNLELTPPQYAQQQQQYAPAQTFTGKMIFFCSHRTRKCEHSDNKIKMISDSACELWPESGENFVSKLSTASRNSYQSRTQLENPFVRVDAISLLLHSSELNIQILPGFISIFVFAITVHLRLMPERQSLLHPMQCFPWNVQIMKPSLLRASENLCRLKIEKCNKKNFSCIMHSIGHISFVSNFLLDFQVFVLFFVS